MTIQTTRQQREAAIREDIEHARRDAVDLAADTEFRQLRADGYGSRGERRDAAEYERRAARGGR